MRGVSLLIRADASSMHEGLDGGERTLAQRATMRNVS
jgi:hypothetical protein